MKEIKRLLSSQLVVDSQWLTVLIFREVGRAK
jgi:hypothetical protein